MKEKYIYVLNITNNLNHNKSYTKKLIVNYNKTYFSYYESNEN